MRRQERTCKQYKSQDALWSIKVYSYILQMGSTSD